MSEWSRILPNLYSGKQSGRRNKHRHCAPSLPHDRIPWNKHRCREKHPSSLPVCSRKSQRRFCPHPSVPTHRKSHRESCPTAPAQPMPRSEKSHPCRQDLQGTAILMSGQSLNDRCELQKLTAVFLEEAVELQRMIGIIGIHHRHRIPFYPVFLQQFDALHHLLPRWFSRSRQPVMVMIRLRTIDRDAYQPMVLGKNSHHSSVSNVPLV